MSQEMIKELVEFQKEYGAVRIVEKFISQNKNHFKTNTTGTYSNAQFYLKYEDMREEIQRAYKINNKTVDLYFTLDKSLYPQLDYDTRERIHRDLQIPKELLEPFYKQSVGVSYIGYETIYRKNITPAISFLQENAQVFPLSSKEYILKKQKKLSRLKNINKMSNSFEEKVFFTGLEDNVKKSDLENWLSIFKKILDRTDRLSTLYHYHNVVERLIEDKGRKDLLPLLGDTTRGFFHHFFNCFRGHEITKTNLPIIMSVIDIFKKDKGFFDKAFLVLHNELKTMGDRNKRVLFFLTNLAYRDTQLEMVMGILDKSLEEDTIYDFVKYKDSDDEFKKIMMTQALRQFFIHNPRMLFLKDIDFSETTTTNTRIRA